MFHERKLTNAEDKNKFNAWDNEEIKGDFLKMALEKIERDNKHINNSSVEVESMKSWDAFYKKHKSNFFKNRKWILNEFKEVSTNRKILDLGCGVGSTLNVFFEYNKNIPENVKPYFDVYGCDFSSEAIALCQKKYNKDSFFLHDLTANDPLPGNFDALFLIFTLSSIEPKYHAHVMKKAYDALKPGGYLYFKDYGILDMVQLRYKSDTVINKNLYKRNDGTLTYFFSEEYFRNITGKFSIVNLLMDKRLLINRKRQLDMYRVYLQSTLRK